MQSRLHGAPRAHRPGHHRRPVQPLGSDGPRALGTGHHVDHHRRPSHPLHLPRNRTAESSRNGINGRPAIEIALLAIKRDRLSRVTISMFATITGSFRLYPGIDRRDVLKSLRGLTSDEVHHVDIEGAIIWVP